MPNIIPFESSNKLPAYIKAFNVSELNADLTAHAGGGFPVISIKGKTFAIVRDGERTVIPNPKDPESPATSIEVVIIKANKNTSKVFYAKGYDKDSEGQKPDCYSNDGIAPAPDAPNPQSKKCATCPHNQWGSRVSDKGTTKGKACSDSVRMAVAPAGMLNDPMLLRVPPASIRALGEYGQMLAKRGVAYNMVVTKIAFDPQAESPKLTFKPVGFLDEAAFEEVQEVVNQPVIGDILGTGVQHTPALAAKTSEAEVPPEPEPEMEPEMEPEPEPTKSAKPAKATKPAKKEEPVVVEDNIEINLDDISFDD